MTTSQYTDKICEFQVENCKMSSIDMDLHHAKKIKEMTSSSPFD